MINIKRFLRFPRILFVFCGLVFISSLVLFPDHPFHVLFQKYISLFISWPIVVLVAILVFHRPIKEKILSLSKLRIKETLLEWPEEGRQLSLDGHLFWAGHDLMWTIYMIEANAEKETIMRGIKKSIEHICSYPHTNISGFNELLNFESKIKEKSAREIIASKNDLIERLWTIKNQIGSEIDQSSGRYSAS